MHFLVTTVHARGHHIETPAEAPDALTAAQSVFALVARCGAVVRVSVDARPGRAVILAPQSPRDVPTHSQVVLEFAAGRSLSLTFRCPPAEALTRAAALIVGAWDDCGPVVSAAAMPLTVPQYDAAAPAAWVR